MVHKYEQYCVVSFFLILQDFVYLDEKLGSEKFTRLLGRERARQHKKSLLSVRAKSSNKLYCSRQGLNVPITQAAFIKRSSHIRCYRHLPKFWDKKPKAATKVTARVTNNMKQYYINYEDSLNILQLQCTLQCSRQSWQLGMSLGSLSNSLNQSTEIMRKKPTVITCTECTWIR